MNIAAALDNAYHPYTYTMLYSLFRSDSEERFHVYLLSGDLSADTKALFEELVQNHHSKVTFLDLDPEPFMPLANRGWALPTAFRLKLGELLKGVCSRLLYLDGDIIVHGSVRPFYDMDLKGHMLGACHDMTVNPETTAIHEAKRSERINKLLREYRYFNAGVLLIDIPRMSDWTLEKYLKLLNDLEEKIVAPDQDLLNVAHEGDWIEADEIRYDLFAGVAKDYGVSLEEVRNQNIILHYAGDKPWQGGHVHYDIERLWWEYALETPFAKQFLNNYIISSLEDGNVYRTVKEITEQNKTLSLELESALNKAKAIAAKLGG